MWWWWWWWSSSSSSSSITAAATIIIAILFFIWRDSPQWAITHNDAPQPVGLLWTSDQPVTETIPDNTQISMLLVEFEPTISAGMWPQTYALDRTATGNGSNNISTHNIFQAVSQSLQIWPQCWWYGGNIDQIRETKKCIATTGMPPLLQ